MIKKALTLCALVPSVSFASVNLESNMREAMASADCLAYLTIIYENTHKADGPATKKHAERYVLSMKKVLSDPEGKKHLKEGLYSRSGIDFDNDFYAGVIFSGTVSDIRQSIKDSIPLDKSSSLPYQTLKEKWSEEAKQRYNNANCDLLK